MKTLTSILLALMLAACGGGEATEQEKAEADAAAFEARLMTVMPVDRAASGAH